MPSSYVAFDNGYFPDLYVKKAVKIEVKPKETPARVQEPKVQVQKKRRKKMADDTSSEDEKILQKQEKIPEKKNGAKDKNPPKKVE